MGYLWWCTDMATQNEVRCDGAIHTVHTHLSERDLNLSRWMKLKMLYCCGDTLRMIINGVCVRCVFASNFFYISRGSVSCKMYNVFVVTRWMDDKKTLFPI